MKVVSTEKAPAAIGPYSQAMVLNGVVYTSGQIAIDPAVGDVTATTIEGQAEQVMKNLGEVLKAAGSSYEKAVKTFKSMHEFLKNMESNKNVLPML